MRIILKFWTELPGVLLQTNQIRTFFVDKTFNGFWDCFGVNPFKAIEQSNVKTHHFDSVGNGDGVVRKFVEFSPLFVSDQNRKNKKQERPFEFNNPKNKEYHVDQCDHGNHQVEKRVMVKIPKGIHQKKLKRQQKKIDKH